MEESSRWISLIRLAISVEGETERGFVNLLLLERLRQIGIESKPILLGGRGGSITVPGMISEMANLAWSHDAVTSLVDYYGLRLKELRQVGELEQAIHRGVLKRLRGRRRVPVVPYVQQYEFEGLLFSKPDAVAAVMCASNRQLKDLRKVRSDFTSPEEINDSPVSAPSKRVKGIFPDYDKVLHGPQIAVRTSIDGIASECPRFRDWIARLESLCKET